MIRPGWLTLTLAGFLFFLLCAPASSGEVEKVPVATEQPQAEVAPPPEEVAEILRLRELLEMMELLQDLDVLAQSEEEK